MSKKKQQANGFLLFMRDMQVDMRGNGRIVPMRDMPVLAGPKWAKLPDREKAVYNARAKAERRAGGAAPGGTGLMYVPPKHGRMDCSGELLSERRDTASEMEERRHKERQIISSSLTAGSAVMLTKFYFIDIQSLCEISERPEARYQPCEIALVEYSLHSGITRSYQRFIDPGPLPLGYRFEAQRRSEATHEIPISGFDQALRDYRQLLWEIESFISPEGSRDIPAVFSKRDNAMRVEWCLEWLACKAGVRNRLDRVYEVEALICELSTHKDGRGPTFHQAKEFLGTTIYDHSIGTRCEWHEERENKHCCLGVVHMYCYVLSDTLCPKYNIALTPSHLPPQTANQPVADSYTPSHFSTKRTSYSVSTVSSPPHTPSPVPTPSHLTTMRGVVGMSQQMEGLSLMGRGRGRGRGFVYREPRGVGQQN